MHRCLGCPGSARSGFAAFEVLCSRTLHTARIWRPRRSDPQARIIWSQGRRLWQHEVGGVAIFRKPPEGEDIGTPFGTGWQLGAELLKGVGAEHIRLPVYMRPMSVTPAVFGPFATGPPGEFVDVGELVVQD